MVLVWARCTTEGGLADDVSGSDRETFAARLSASSPVGPGADNTVDGALFVAWSALNCGWALNGRVGLDDLSCTAVDTVASLRASSPRSPGGESTLGNARLSVAVSLLDEFWARLSTVSWFSDNSSSSVLDTSLALERASLPNAPW